MTNSLWIDEPEALVIHERLLVRHGGAGGVRDSGLLRSALPRPRQHAAYADGLDIVHLATAHTVAVIGNHPFVDGNKHTGFVLGILFLEMNGHAFTATQEDAANAVLAVTAGRMDEWGYAAFLAENSRRSGPAV